MYFFSIKTNLVPKNGNRKMLQKNHKNYSRPRHAISIFLSPNYNKNRKNNQKYKWY